MRIGIRLAITSLVLAYIIVSAIGVHLLWWRTAEGNSSVLKRRIDQYQVVVGDIQFEKRETTIRHLLIGLAVLVAAAAVLSAWLARRLLAKR